MATCLIGYVRTCWCCTASGQWASVLGARVCQWVECIYCCIFCRPRIIECAPALLVYPETQCTQRTTWCSTRHLPQLCLSRGYSYPAEGSFRHPAVHVAPTMSGIVLRVGSVLSNTGSKLGCLRHAWLLPQWCMWLAISPRLTCSSALRSARSVHAGHMHFLGGGRALSGQGLRLYICPPRSVVVHSLATCASATKR